jgi:hypothetical protein
VGNNVATSHSTETRPSSFFGSDYSELGSTCQVEHWSLQTSTGMNLQQGPPDPCVLVVKPGETLETFDIL